jgi:hypothetical protein
VRIRYGLAIALAVAMALGGCEGNHHRARPRPQPAPYPGLAQVQLVAQHVRGVGNDGRGPVPGEVSVMRDGALVQRVAVPTLGGRLALPPGRYVFSATIHDGRCESITIPVMGGTTATVTLSCEDGISTD